MAEAIQHFFRQAEEIWGAFPGYFKVFIYSTASSAAGLYFTGELSINAVVAIVLINLGIYQVPRTVNQEVKRLS